MTLALTFPGQGSQTVGMGRTLYDVYRPARDVFERVDEALGERLSATIFEGPEDTLRLTANAQPALMAVSLAALAALKAEGLALTEVALVAGHSLGEYSALAAAEALTVEDAASLLRLRGEAMQSAVPAGEGAMAALLGLDLAAAEALAADTAEGDVLDVANDNAPGQSVLSGTTAAVERAAGEAKARGARKAVLLPVSAPFHCRLMAPAADAMERALAARELAPPQVPLIANVTATRLTDPDAIRNSLVAQVTGRVRWRESVAGFAGAGVTDVLEVGAGSVLTGLLKRIDRQLTGRAVGTADEVAAFAEAWSAA